jgi:hypothetical protein
LLSGSRAGRPPGIVHDRHLPLQSLLAVAARVPGQVQNSCRAENYRGPGQTFIRPQFQQPQFQQPQFQQPQIQQPQIQRRAVRRA